MVLLAVTEFEFLQHFGSINARLGESFMNYVAIYLAVLAAIHFAGARLPASLLACLVTTFTLYLSINLMEQMTLVRTYAQAQLALGEQYAGEIPISLTTKAPTIFGIPFATLGYPLLYFISWTSVLLYSVYQYRVSSRGSADREVGDES